MITDGERSENLSQVFNDYYLKHRRSTFARAMKRAGNKQDAEDAVQETFLREWQRSKAGIPLPNEQSQRNGLGTIAQRICIDNFRKINREVPMPENNPPDPPSIDPLDDPEKIAIDLYTCQSLLPSLDQLSPQARNVFLQRTYLDLEFGQIGDNLEIPENTAKTSFRRSKIKLRGLLEDFKDDALI